jgi:hypothetical protein
MGRNTWRQLTAMGTALVLLFLLALAAIPSAVLPQRGLNSQGVAAYAAACPTLGHVMDTLQLFDVFASFWFTTIYVLAARFADRRSHTTPARPRQSAARPAGFGLPQPVATRPRLHRDTRRNPGGDRRPGGVAA